MISLISGIMVIAGAVFMLAAIIHGKKLKPDVPDALVNKWRVMIVLMLFFLAGYLTFVAILISRVKLPTELVTGPVFLGGAFFVYIVINLSRDTIRKIRGTETELRQLNESLEQRVQERTRDLQRAHAFLRTVLDSLNDSVAIIDVKDFGIIGANAPFLREMGLTEAEVVGKKCYEVTHNRHDVCTPPDDICPLLDTIRTGKPATAEHLHYDRTGRRLFVEISSSPILGADGTVTQIVHVSRDITERKAAEERLRRYAEDLAQSNEELKNFTYLFSHDMRTPLVNLKGFSGELADTLRDIEAAFRQCGPCLDNVRREHMERAFQKEVPESLAFIRSSARKMDQIIGTVLKLSRLGQKELKPAPVDLQELVRDVLKTLDR